MRTRALVSLNVLPSWKLAVHCRCMQTFSFFPIPYPILVGSKRCWSQRSLVTQNIQLHMLDSSMESIGSHWNPKVNCKPHSVKLSYLAPFLLESLGPLPFGDTCSCFALDFAEAFTLAFAVGFRARSLALASLSESCFTCFGRKGLHQGLLVIIWRAEKTKGSSRL